MFTNTMKIDIIFLLCFLLTSDELIEGKIPSGHGEELGKHRFSDGHVEQLNEIPAPELFWENYASIRKPVVFKGAAKQFPAYTLWTDEFLIKNFGNLEVKLEAKKEKENIPIGEKGLGRDSIKSYLKDYKTKDSYVVSQLPDPMARDVLVLPCLRCGTFAERIMEADLWLSSGGTSSLLHRDADNAINCLLNGTKDWILINPKYEDLIPVAQGDKGYGGFAVLDVNSVNLIKYSDFQHVPWQYANLSAGDCLFLPYGYWHQVRSYGSKNMAVSVLFSRLKEFSSNGCDRTEYKPISLANARVVWTYPGHGTQTLGNSDPFEIRDFLAEMVRDFENRNVALDNSNVLYQWFSEGNLLDDENEKKNVAELVYQDLKTFTDGNITSEAIMKLTVDQLKRLVLLMDADPANTEEYEQAVFSPEDIRNTIQTALVENDGSLSQEMLITTYKSLGGSENIARELFLDMDINKDGVVTEAEVSQTLDDVLVKFKEYQPDPSNDYYMEELEKDKEMMRKIENEHVDL